MTHHEIEYKFVFLTAGGSVETLDADLAAAVASDGGGWRVVTTQIVGGPLLVLLER